tara:strand:- start:727 stop:1908 length:1182 start_codon:yes stop_codon:yes gene_type:complete
MRFTPEIQACLGEAALVADDSVIAIVSGSWAIFIQNPENYIDAEKLDWLAGRITDSGCQINYKVLCAKEVQDSHFLAADGKKMETINSSLHVGRDLYKMTEEIIYKHRDCFEGSANISEMFRRGKSEPHFITKEGDNVVSRLTSGRDKAESYRFRCEDKVISISGDFLRGFTALGFDVILNTDPDKESRGVLGLVHEDENLYGLVMPLRETGITTDSQGRDLYMDAYGVCWIDEVEAKELITQDLGFFDPAMSSPDWGDLDLDDRIRQRKWSKAAKGISALRWKGLPDSEIKNIAIGAQYDAWCDMYKKALSDANTLIETMDNFAKRTEEITSNTVLQVRHYAKKASDLCDRVETLTDVMNEYGGDGGDGLGIGPLENLVEYVERLEEICGLS